MSCICTASGGIGDDNLKQISGGNTRGTHVWTTPDAQRKHPTYVLAPQLPRGQQWAAPDSDRLSSHAETLVQLIAALTQEFSLDPDRVFLTGQSLGGGGTWDIISKRPDPDVGHDVWTRAYVDPALADWLFGQRRAIR